jgi:hypothetical protein
VIRYIIKIRRNQRGANGSTRYKFSTKLKAVLFAVGFQAGLTDSGNSDIYVSVWECDRDKASLIMDAPQLEEIARKEF